MPLLLLAVEVANGESVAVRRLGELVEKADLIARVKVLSVSETGASEGGYGKVSLVSVTEGIKGSEAGESFKSEHSLVEIACPNVSYEVGEDVLLFAVKSPDGRYSTLYAYTGKFRVVDERVEHEPFTRGQTYRSAVAQIRREIEKLRVVSR